MPNLAGFDLILEVARQALERELLNSPLATGPNGSPNDTLVPPFRLTRNVPLPGMTGLLSLKVTGLSLQAHPQSSNLTLNLTFEEGSLEAPGVALAMLAGQGSVTAPLYFTPPAPAAGAPLPLSSLVLDFNQATSNLQLDPASSNQVDAAVGPVLGPSIRSALSTALTALFKSQGVVNLNFAFAVDASRDSTDMMVLSSAPQVRWVDAETLAIFGYHRQGASTGNAAWKNQSDLPPAPYPGFPWYPIAVLISPSSFRQLVACPSIRTAARDHVAGRYRNAWIDEERAKNNNQGKATPGEIAAAENRLTQYLNSPAGQGEIQGAFPAPCGPGQLDQRIKMPDPFSDTTGYIHWLSMELGQGRVEVRAKARAEVFCGSVDVEVPMSFQPTIGPNNSIQPGPLAKGQPHSSVNADFICEAAIAFLSSFLVGPLIGSVFAVLAVSVAESLAEGLINKEILKQNLPTPQANTAGPALPPGVRLREVLVDPSGLTVLGVWDGLVIDPHKFDPSVHLYWQTDHSRSETVFMEAGTFEASCGGEPRTFRYIPRAWNTRVRYRVEIGDVPQPVRYDDWWLWHDGVAHKLAPGTLAFPGRVIVPEPPNKETLQPHSQIVIQVDGSNEQGYTLTFRAEDLNVPFQIDTRVVDGSGRSWPLGTNHQTSQGLTFEFDEEYRDFREECARFIIGVGSRYKLVQEVPVWDKVTSFEHVVQERVRGVLGGQVLGAAAALREILVDMPELEQQMFQ